jgi:hypothetical protein
VRINAWFDDGNNLHLVTPYIMGNVRRDGRKRGDLKLSSRSGEKSDRNADYAQDPFHKR